MMRDYETELPYKNDRYLTNLSKEENEMLDVMADIITGYVLRKGYEINKERKRQEELNHYCADFV